MCFALQKASLVQINPGQTLPTPLQTLPTPTTTSPGRLQVAFGAVVPPASASVVVVGVLGSVSRRTCREV